MRWVGLRESDVLYKCLSQTIDEICDSKAAAGVQCVSSVGL